MVLGFGKAEGRFPTTKEQVPGPGSYDPKELATKLAPSCGFPAKDRFSVDLEDHQTKQGSTSARERRFPWSTRFGGSDTNKRAEAKVPKEAYKDRALKTEADSRTALQERLCACLKEISDVQNELAEETSKRTKQEQQLACIEISFDTAKYELEVSKGKIAELEAALELSTASADHLTKELSDARVESSGLQERLAAVKAELSATQRQVTDLQSELKDKDTRLDGVNTQAVAELQGLYKELADAKLALRKAQEALAEKEKSVTCASLEIADLKKLLHSEQAVARGLTAELQARREELEAATSREKALSFIKAELEERLAGEASAGGSLSVALALQEHVLAMQQELDTQREAASAVDARLKKMQDEAHRQLVKYEEQLVKQLKLEDENASLASTVEQQDEALSVWQATEIRWQGAIADKESDVADLCLQLAICHAALQDRDAEVEQLKKAMVQQETLVADLQCKVAQLGITVRDCATSAVRPVH